MVRSAIESWVLWFCCLCCLLELLLIWLLRWDGYSRGLVFETCRIGDVTLMRLEINIIFFITCGDLLYNQIFRFFFFFGDETLLDGRFHSTSCSPCWLWCSGLSIWCRCGSWFCFLLCWRLWNAMVMWVYDRFIYRLSIHEWK